MFKRFFVAIFLSIAVFSSATFAQSLPYDDVTNTDDFFYAVEYLRRNDVITDATRQFKPDQLVTKAEFIKWLVLINKSDGFKVNTEGIDLPFDDTRNNDWYSPYIEEAIKMGIVSDREKNLEPNKKLGLIEALELLFHSKSIPIPKVYNGSVNFSDLEKNERAQPLVMRAITLDIIEPERSNYVGIYRKVTRAKAADMIHRMDMINYQIPTITTNQTGNYDMGLQKIISAWELIQANSINRNDITDEELTSAAIRSLLDNIDDDFSDYRTPEENEALNTSLDGEIEGIGAVITETEGKKGIEVVTPIPDGPAFHAGLKAGDIIIKVGNRSTEGMSVEDAVVIIKGPKGTSVKLTIKRGSQTIEKTIVRDRIRIDAVEYEVLENNIAHIKLTTFNQNAKADFRDTVDVILNDKNIKGVIIDVRDNPGGLLGETIAILDMILPPDTKSLTVQYNYFNATEYTGNRGGELSAYPMVVLINEGSASASEIVAGALKDHDIATVIGQTSFGKGTVQEVNYFEDNSSLKLTVARWLTPSGHSIQDNGIKPDINVTNEGTNRDRQLERAIEELKKKIR